MLLVVVSCGVLSAGCWYLLLRVVDCWRLLLRVVAVVCLLVVYNS